MHTTEFEPQIFQLFKFKSLFLTTILLNKKNYYSIHNQFYPNFNPLRYIQISRSSTTTVEFSILGV